MIKGEASKPLIVFPNSDPVTSETETVTVRVAETPAPESSGNERLLKEGMKEAFITGSCPHCAIERSLNAPPLSLASVFTTSSGKYTEGGGGTAPPLETF